MLVRCAGGRDYRLCHGLCDSMFARPRPAQAGRGPVVLEANRVGSQPHAEQGSLVMRERSSPTVFPQFVHQGCEGNVVAPRPVP